MPIVYEIHDKGRFIYAKAFGTVTDQDLLEYEMAHASDERIKGPADEVLDITADAKVLLTREGIQEALRIAGQMGDRWPCRRCAIVVRGFGQEIWDLAKFYETMSHSYARFSVIVFGNADVANIWLGRSPPRQPKQTSLAD
jgi:hypothetical protein